MKLRDYGSEAFRDWFQQILGWSRNKITFLDNIDGIFVKHYINTAETEVGHTLGRIPRFIFEVAEYPNGTAGISFTKSPTIDKMFLTRNSAGECTLFII